MRPCKWLKTADIRAKSRISLDAFDALPADAVRAVFRSHVASADCTATTRSASRAMRAPCRRNARAPATGREARCQIDADRVRETRGQPRERERCVLPESGGARVAGMRFLAACMARKGRCIQCSSNLVLWNSPISPLTGS
jgi:hypothetical protein